MALRLRSGQASADPAGVRAGRPQPLGRPPASLDISSQVDRSEITIGDRIQYEIKVVYPEEGRVELPSVLGNLGSFEVKDYQASDPKEAGKLLIQTWRFDLSTFTVGKYTIPPQQVAYRQGADTAAAVCFTQPIEINVIRTSPETVKDIADIAPLAEVEGRAALARHRPGRRRAVGPGRCSSGAGPRASAAVAAAKPALPPFEEAMARLAGLKDLAAHPAEPGPRILLHPFRDPAPLHLPPLRHRRPGIHHLRVPGQDPQAARHRRAKAMAGQILRRHGPGQVRQRRPCWKAMRRPCSPRPRNSSARPGPAKTRCRRRRAGRRIAFGQTRLPRTEAQSRPPIHRFKRRLSAGSEPRGESKGPRRTPGSAGPKSPGPAPDTPRAAMAMTTTARDGSHEPAPFPESVFPDRARWSSPFWPGIISARTRSARRASAFPSLAIIKRVPAQHGLQGQAYAAGAAPARHRPHVHRPGPAPIRRGHRGRHHQRRGHHARPGHLRFHAHHGLPPAEPPRGGQEGHRELRPGPAARSHRPGGLFRQELHPMPAHPGLRHPGAVPAASGFRHGGGRHRHRHRACSTPPTACGSPGPRAR